AALLERDTARCLQGIRPTVANPPEKFKALRREGPKRGARELMRIIGRPTSLVNRSTVSNCPAPTVGKPGTLRITIRKKFQRPPRRSVAFRRRAAIRRCREARPVPSAGFRKAASTVSGCNGPPPGRLTAAG